MWFKKIELQLNMNLLTGSQGLIIFRVAGMEQDFEGGMR
jgi:hypothetical protein